MNRRLILLLLSLITFVSLTLPAVAADIRGYQCPYKEPEKSEIWRAFDALLKREYNPSNNPYSPYSYGHALSRLALANNNDPRRLAAFDCVERVVLGLLDLGVAVGATTTSVNSGAESYQLFRESWIEHDDVVAARHGVRTRAPLENVFVEGLRSFPAEYLLKTKPGAGGGGGGAGPVTGGGSNQGGSTGQSSVLPTVSGTNTQCVMGGGWSLSQARTHITNARRIMGRLKSDCTGDGYNTCKAASDAYHEARDHIFQVFDQNHDGIANCRLCNYDNAIAIARELVDAEGRFTALYFRGANGLGNIFYTISDNKDDPLCDAKVQPPVDPPADDPVIPPSEDQPEPEGAICRDLHPGERWHPIYVHCCDIGGNQSVWRHRTGSESTHLGTCSSWGIKGGAAAEAASAKICRALRSGDKYYPGYTHCCDLPDGRSRWRSSSGGESDHLGNCRSWGITP